MSPNSWSGEAGTGSDLMLRKVAENLIRQRRYIPQPRVAQRTLGRDSYRLAYAEGVTQTTQLLAVIENVAVIENAQLLLNHIKKSHPFWVALNIQ